MLNLFGDFLLGSPGTGPSLPVTNSGPKQVANAISPDSGSPYTPFAAELLTHYASGDAEQAVNPLSSLTAQAAPAGLPPTIPATPIHNTQPQHGELLPQTGDTAEILVPSGNELPQQPIIRTAIQPTTESTPLVESAIATLTQSPGPKSEGGTPITQATLAAYAQQSTVLLPASPVRGYSTTVTSGVPNALVPANPETVRSGNVPLSLAPLLAGTQEVPLTDSQRALRMESTTNQPSPPALPQSPNITRVEVKQPKQSLGLDIPETQAATWRPGPTSSATVATASDAQLGDLLARALGQGPADSARTLTPPQQVGAPVSRTSAQDQPPLLPRSPTSSLSQGSASTPTPVADPALISAPSSAKLSQNLRQSHSQNNPLRTGGALAWSSNAVGQGVTRHAGDTAPAMIDLLFERGVGPKLSPQQFGPILSNTGEGSDATTTATSLVKETAAGVSTTSSSPPLSSPAPQTAINAKSLEFMQMDLRDSRGALAEQLSRLIEQRMGTPGVIRIALQPAELGQLELTFSNQQDQMAVVMSAHNGQTRDLLEAHVEKIRSLLSDFGVDQAKVEVASDWAGQNSDQQKTSNTRDHSARPKATSDGQIQASTQDVLPTTRTSDHQGAIDAYA